MNCASGGWERAGNELHLSRGVVAEPEVSKLCPSRILGAMLLFGYH